MKKTIYLAGGCFWGAQKYLDNIRGVSDTLVGYANGDNPSITYKQVCAGSGHAEVVKVEYDDTLSTDKLLDLFVQIINPFSFNMQGHDVGVQYRTGIYFVDSIVESEAQQWLNKFSANQSQKVAIECKPLLHFCLAEKEHQKYLDNNPNGYCHVPKHMFDFAKIESNK